jgi:hypothetical protein
MFKHFWPEENCCDKCGTKRSGAMLYISNVPVSFICEVCDPKKRSDAITFSMNISDEEELNGWEWLIP